MPAAKRLAVLMPLVALFLGLGLGLAGGALFPGSRPGAAPELAATGPERESGGADGGAASAQIARLRAELARWKRAGADRREAETRALSEPDAHAPVAADADAGPAPKHGAGGQAAAELDRAFDMLAGYFEESPEELTWFLTMSYLENGRPQEALAMLERMSAGAHGVDPELFGQVGLHLEQSGDAAAAANALERALAAAPADGDLAEALTRVDPARALAALEASIAGQTPPGHLRSRLSRARALAALGRGPEAYSALEAMLGEGPTDAEVLETMGTIDPQRAEQRLREYVASGDGSEQAQAVLARLLADSGRHAEAADLYVSLLAERPGDSELRGELLALDPERGFQYLLQAVTQDPEHAGLLNDLGQQWLARGETTLAIEAWFDAFVREPGSSPWEQQLLHHAPDRLIAAYEESVQGSEDDELWGDLGDTYWLQGRRADARAAWERAALIDPGDGEWSGKLAALAAGRNPLE